MNSQGKQNENQKKGKGEKASHGGNTENSENKS